MFIGLGVAGLGFKAEFELSVDRNIVGEQFLSTLASGDLTQRRLGELDAQSVGATIVPGQLQKAVLSLSTGRDDKCWPTRERELPPAAWIGYGTRLKLQKLSFRDWRRVVGWSVFFARLFKRCLVERGGNRPVDEDERNTVASLQFLAKLPDKKVRGNTLCRLAASSDGKARQFGPPRYRPIQIRRRPTRRRNRLSKGVHHS